MTKMITLVGLLFAFAAAARANIGDTPEQSAARYGKPFSRFKHTLYYHTRKGWIIAEWYTQEGRVGVISYMKQRGEITQAEIEAFNGTNISSGVSANDWLELESKDANIRAWITLDKAWYQANPAMMISRAGFSAACISTRQAYRRLRRCGEAADVSK